MKCGISYFISRNTLCCQISNKKWIGIAIFVLSVKMPIQEKRFGLIKSSEYSVLMSLVSQNGRLLWKFGNTNTAQKDKSKSNPSKFTNALEICGWTYSIFLALGAICNAIDIFHPYTHGGRSFFSFGVLANIKILQTDYLYICI